MDRVFNFNAGPSAMPLEVLQEVQAEFLDFKHTGMSIVEISHRSKVYQAMQDETVELLKQLLKIPEGYKVVFMQGGGSLQFVMHGANFLQHKGGYLNTGVWSKKAKEAAAEFGEVYDVASSEEDNFSYIPKIPETGTFELEEKTDYVYMTSNNTIHGTAWKNYPKFLVPLFCDMSSDFLSHPIPVENFDFIYAGIQKNVGPAGAVIGIIKEELLTKARRNLPAMLQYKTFVDSDSTYNTPPVFSIYFVNKVLHWLERMGGLEEMARRNAEKAALIYKAIDDSDGFYNGHAQRDSRSFMNITFNLANPELESKFLVGANKRNLIGLKGHRSIGGLRASLYNAVTLEACQALVAYMNIFKNEERE